MRGRRRRLGLRQPTSRAGRRGAGQQTTFGRTSVAFGCVPWSARTRRLHSLPLFYRPSRFYTLLRIKPSCLPLSPDN